MSNQIQKDFLAFYKSAESLLYIQNTADHDAALRTTETLMEITADDPTHPLNGLITLLASSIECYEEKDDEIAAFVKAANDEPVDVALFRLLMENHDLGTADFPEIGDKSLISRILKGERNLTKKHISSLSKRFGVKPGLFFE